MTPIEPDPQAGLNGAVADELRAMKARRRSSNEQIAERSGIPLVSVNRYMAGKRPINLAVLSELAAALDADPAEIVSGALAELGPGATVTNLSDHRGTVQRSGEQIADAALDPIEGQDQHPGEPEE